MKQRQPANDKLDEIAFTTINREIDLLLRRLHSKRRLPVLCRTGPDVSRRNFANVAGLKDTVALCMDVADSIQPDDAGISESHTQH